ncbi:MAG: nucleoside triphosphate pyrophosphohydrolase family protein [Proteobacteria bacterium]|nr:nucleoside triphosphate pyrophosphohydrolase family protein [Pseudomonadota bacterium]
MTRLTEWDYPEFVDGRCGQKDPYKRQVLAALGLAGETGEVVEIWKKVIDRGRELDRDHLVEEMGDVFWYFTLMMLDNDITLDEICRTNMAKLKKRYPNNEAPK